MAVNGAITVSGNNQAAGGQVDIRAARDVSITQAIDATGGGGDGGEIEVDAGDSINITKTLDVSSRVGGGFGGVMALAAGEDALGGVVTGGTLTININNATMKLNGSDAETSGGDGGDLEVTARGLLQIIGSGTAIQANGGGIFDGSGGSVFFDSGDANANTIGPLDGNLVIAGAIILQSGGAGGDGGIFDFTAGRDLTLTGAIDVSGTDAGGDVTGDAGGAILIGGAITAQGTAATGETGFVDFTAGLASNGTLTVARNILATGGDSSGSGQNISLAGCTLIVNDNVKIDGHAGVSALNSQGGSIIDLISRQVMQLRAGSQYLAYPGGAIVTTHPPGNDPQIGAGVVFNPPRDDNPDRHRRLSQLPRVRRRHPPSGRGVRQGRGCRRRLLQRDLLGVHLRDRDSDPGAAHRDGNPDAYADTHRDGHERRDPRRSDGRADRDRNHHHRRDRDANRHRDGRRHRDRHAHADARRPRRPPRPSSITTSATRRARHPERRGSCSSSTDSRTRSSRSSPRSSRPTRSARPST